MIQNTIDAIKDAETAAEKKVEAAKREASKMKTEVKEEADLFRNAQFQKAEEDSARAMDETVSQCREKTRQTKQRIAAEVAEINKEAAEKMEGAVEAVIRSLVG